MDWRLLRCQCRRGRVAHTGSRSRKLVTKISQQMHPTPLTRGPHRRISDFRRQRSVHAATPAAALAFPAGPSKLADLSDFTAAAELAVQAAGMALPARSLLLLARIFGLAIEQGGSSRCSPKGAGGTRQLGADSPYDGGRCDRRLQDLLLNGARHFLPRTRRPATSEDQ
jgi:hypothetical protein